MRIARQAGTVHLVVLALIIAAGAFSSIVNQRSPLPAPFSSDPGAQLRAAAKQRPSNKTEQMIWTLQDRIRRAPAHIDSYAQLGSAYVQRARETGDPSYYAKAEAALGVALKRDPQHVETLISRGGLALARHDFRAALALGEQARQLNPTIPRIYGVVGDAQIELGMYDEAVLTIQTMVDMRPDLNSYSRVSYLRELYGDTPGAIEAMRDALSAGGAVAENTEWVRVQLGHLYFNQGDLNAAEQQYRQALAMLPDYVPAITALARVLAERQQYPTAIKLLVDATQRMPLPEYVILLGDVYTRQGDHRRALQQYELVRAIDTLFAAGGVNTDLETALFMADHDIDLPESLAKARAAYSARPSIHAADVLAWTLYKTGEYAEAERYAHEALRLGTRDALKLFHAGMIVRALGQNDVARRYLQRALEINPHFSLLYADDAASALEALAGASGTEGSK